MRNLHRKAHPGLFHEMCATEGIRPGGDEFRRGKVVGTSARSGTGVMKVVGLLRRLYSPRTERFDPNQPLLFADAFDTPVEPAAQDALPAASLKPDASTGTRKKQPGHGHKGLESLHNNGPSD
jgi:hypothetical protein